MALIVAWPKPLANDVSAMKHEVQSAVHHLEERGWSVPAPYEDNDNWEDIANRIKSNPCIRGLYVTTHGTSASDIRLYRADRVDHISIEDFANSIPPGQLDFFTINSCYPDKQRWEQCPSLQGTEIFVTRSFVKGKITNGDLVWRDVDVNYHGVPLTSCGPGGLSQLCEMAHGAMATTSDIGCAMFRIFDPSRPDEDLFPATA